MSARNVGTAGDPDDVVISDEQLAEMVTIIKMATQGEDVPGQANTTTAGAGIRPSEIRPPRTAAEANAMIAELCQLAGLDPPPIPVVESEPRPSAASARLAELRARLYANHDNARDGYAKTVERMPMDIPLSAIRQTRVTNIRILENEDSLNSLRESMRCEGQLQEIIVVADVHWEGRYELVTGSRRVRAAAALGWPSIKALVLPPGTPEEELFVQNAVENAQRFDLTSFEIASRAQLMRDRFRMPFDEFARRIGKSKSRVQNLVRYLERLPQDILEAWRAHDRLLSDHMLDRLASMPPDKASVFWAEWRARQVANAARPHGQRNRSGRSRNRPTATTLSRLWSTVKESPLLDEKTRKLVTEIVEFCAGFAATVPGIFDPKQVRAINRHGPVPPAQPPEDAEPDLEPSDVEPPNCDPPDLNAENAMPIPCEIDEHEDDES